MGNFVGVAPNPRRGAFRLLDKTVRAEPPAGEWGLKK
jgi:hypothetical protein